MKSLLVPVRRFAVAATALTVAALIACGDDPTPAPPLVPADAQAALANTPAPVDAPTATPLPELTDKQARSDTSASTPEATAAPTSTPGAAETDQTTSNDQGSAIPYAIDGAGRKLLAVYMVGSDLEEEDMAGTIDLAELIEGYDRLRGDEVEVVVAFGGANKDGWRGMKFADIRQLQDDLEDGEFGNEAGDEAYLYQDAGGNMGDESSLEWFLDYLGEGYVNFDRRFLVFWDHGNSYRGFGGDTNFNGDELSMDEMERAFLNGGAGKFDLIGFDACLMASMEVAKVIAPHAEYMIASEELEPGHGWLWSYVIQAYAEEDDVVEVGTRIVNNFVQDVHEYKDIGKTLSLLDLDEYDRVVAALNPVVSSFGEHLLSSYEYSDSLIHGAIRVRSYGESERENTRVAVDLKHFTRLLGEKSPSPEIDARLDGLANAIDRFVVHSMHDGSRPNSFGVSIDAPENTEAEYRDYKVNDVWLGFQDAFGDFLRSDTMPPELVEWNSVPEGTVAVFEDDNLALVTTLYGFVEPVAVEHEDGSESDEDYFMVVAELETYLTENEGEHFAPAWNQYWFTVEYDTDQDTAWIPAAFAEWYEEDGHQYTVYTAEIDYYRAGESTADPAVMTLIVRDEDMEVVDHYIQTYQDVEGTIRFDKATYQMRRGDGIQFWQFGFSLEDPSGDGWFEASDVITLAQDPVFQIELLRFADESGQLIEYEYAIWAEDVSDNGVLSEPIAVEP